MGIETFGDLGTLFDGPHATPTRTDEGPYFLNIASLKSGRLDLAESDHVSAHDFQSWTRRVTPRGGDLLFSYETRLGEAALMPSGIDACLGRRMALLRPDVAKVDPKYLLYYFLSPSFRRMIERNAVHGATVSRIGLSSMPRWPVNVHPFAEQVAIAQVLGALDDKIAANESVRTRAWELARNSFTRDLFRLNAIEDITLGELSSRGQLVLSDGYRTKASEHRRPGLRILRAGDIRPDRIDLQGDDFVSLDYVGAIGAKASMPYDIVVTTKGTVGRVAVMPEGQEQVVYSPQLCYFRVVDHENLSREFLAGWFRSSDFAAQAEMRMYKSDMAPYINLKDIQSMVVPVPVEMVDQRRIGDRQGALQQLAHSIDIENARLAATRDELLPLLMSGKLRVKAAEEVVEDSL